MTVDKIDTIPNAERQLASLPLAVILLEPGLLIASANPAAEQFLGQSAKRLVGRKLSEAIELSDDHLIDRIGDTETPMSAREQDVAIPGLGGGFRRIDLTTSPVADMAGWQLLTIHDNSAVEALVDDSGAGDYASLRGREVLAHEIKNPLAGIRGAAQLLGRKASGKDRTLTDLITAEVDRIAKLIEQMQRLSGRTVAQVEPCNLHQIARRAIAILDAADGAKGPEIPVEEEFDPSLPPVLGNPDGLVQVLINLLSNAREACGDTENSRVIMRTRFASGLQLHSTQTGKLMRLPIEVRIGDNGPGVDPAMREHIFKPFITSKNTGQGLGLPLVQKLVRDMNGRVGHVRDESAGWTYFHIHLPLATDANGDGQTSIAQS